VNELSLVAPLGGIIVIALFYMRRIERSAAALAWGAAWTSLYLAGLSSSVPELHPALVAAGYLTGSLFPGFLLAGALAFRNGGALARGPIAAGAAIGLIRTSLVLLDHEAIAHAITAPLEAPLAIGASVVMWRSARGRPRSFAEQMLPPVLMLLALVNAADPLARLLGLEMVPLVFAWISTCLATAMLQVAAFVERSREREHQLLVERDLLHRIARMATEGRDRAAVLEETASAIAEAHWYDQLGIWLVGADGRDFECAALVPRERLPEAFLRFPIDLPILREVLAVDDPVLLAADLGAERSRYAPIGLGEVAAAALRAHGRTLGLVVAGLGFERHFTENELRALGSLARELALVLAHVESTEERRAQATALESERRQLRALVAAVPVGIMLVDREGRITTMSRAGSTTPFLVGDPEQWIGRLGRDTVAVYADRVDAASRKRLREWSSQIQRQGRGDVELHFDRPEDRTIIVSARPVVSDDGELLGRLFVSRDVTEERRLAERFQRMQRMETLGTLASGVAHDFNNQLTAVLGNARLLDTCVTTGPGRAALADLEIAAEHCAELAGSLLDLARQAPLAIAPVAVERIFREVDSLLRTTLPAGVRLRVSTAPGACVRADAGQLRRVVTNLALNARDAVGTSGEIELYACAPLDGHVEIGVRDTGSGMEPATLERVFDPFFTTKPAGKGTGLGLSIVYRIVAAHGASIAIESEPGRGSCFRMTWPSAVAGSSSAAIESASEPGGAGELVLLAEDDPGVRRLAMRALERHGYRVVAACDGEEALDLFERHAGDVALVVSDLAMPRRGGREVLSVIRARAPGIAAVLMTGHEGDADLPGGAVLLRKPFRPEDLAVAARRALDDAKG
jgi:signal transduction histidine kinase/CheY-like chemotaxis protein